MYNHPPQDFKMLWSRPFKYSYIFVTLRRRYECRAQNPYGEAIHEMELAEARLPGMMSQVITKGLNPKRAQNPYGESVQKTDLAEAWPSGMKSQIIL